MDVLEKAQQKIDALQHTVNKLRMQRESIDAQLTQNERELGKLLAFIDTYRQLVEDQPKPVAETLTEYVHRLHRTRSELTPKKIEAIAEAYLRHEAPKRTPELVAYLEAKGCEIPGANKDGYVAGVLSRSKRFVARRRFGGWFLVENDPAAGSDETPELPELENQGYKGETPSVGAEGVSDTATQAAVGGGLESDDLL